MLKTSLIGASAAMERVARVVARVIESPATVLITGETGTGKELVARAIHLLGPRRARSFVAQNCTSLPEPLLESELFGHARGAFTGAFREQRGLFEDADGGTLFLDEVGDMPLLMQVKLLRVLEEGRIRRLGSRQTIDVDVRLVAATHKDLRAEVEAGRFRQDLYYRLDVLRVHLPPLRERHGDVELLARHFLAAHGARSGKRLPGLTERALNALERYSFPGNVRELENEIERAVALANPGESLDLHLLSPEIARGAEQNGTANRRGNLIARLQRVERSLIREELQRHGGNRTRSAAHLGISVRALQKKIHRLGLKDDPA